MNLKDFLASRDKPPELYWSLVLEPNWVQAGIWYIGPTAAEVLNVSPGAAWETDEEIIGAADAALSSCVQKLPENYPEPQKTVFGVPGAWVKEGNISDEYLAKIKNICTELSLIPVGFVVIPEAIAHLYKSEEGTPLSAVIIGLGKEFLELTVFKLGNMVGTTSVSRSVSLIEDVTEGLARFEGASPLPSRIVLFDGKEGELEDAKESLMQASWEGAKFKFLHTPKIETLAADKKVVATSLAGAAEIGHVTTVASKDEEQLHVEEVANVTQPDEEISAKDLGFALGEDVSVNTPAPKIREPGPVVPVNIPKPSLPITGGMVNKVKNLFGRFPKNFFANSLAKASGVNKKTAALAPFILVGLLLLGFAAWWFLPKATVTVYVSPRNFEKDANLSFSSTGVNDPGNGVIPATALTTLVNGEKTKATSGTKLIGDKATGSVQISNGNPNAIDLAAGTILTSSGSLKFVTASEASVSGQVLPGQPGTAQVNVNAYDIGSQYNLAKGEIFSVGNFSKSLVAATSQADFSGGSSQTISAVSKDDQTSLENDLKNELVQQAISDLGGKIDANTQIFVNDLAKTEIATENFDHKVGDQADNLKLSLSLNVTGIAADKSKLLDYAKGILNGNVPPGFVLRNDQISFKFTFSDQNGSLYDYQAQVGANFLPSVNTDQLINQISGKTPDVAETYLNSIPGFVRVQVKLRPNLPNFLSTLPHIHKNITIDVVAEQ